MTAAKVAERFSGPMDVGYLLIKKSWKPVCVTDAGEIRR
jgi:hypothetical protein